MRIRESLIGLGLGLMAISAAAQVTGSGTSGTVPQFTGTSAIGNSPISISGSNVGIGTTAPQKTLDIAGAMSGAMRVYSATGNLGTAWANTADIYLGDTVANSTYMELGRTAQTNGSAYIQSFAGGVGGVSLLLNMLGGNVGIGMTSPAYRLDVAGQIHTAGGIVLPDGSVQSTAWTGVLCGGDYAESVDVSGDRTHYGPGDVLVIDPGAPGKFLKSAEPYSTAVLGVYSTKPGVLGRHQTGPTNPDEVPMAMVGIVPTKVSAENGAIRPGDLLVTASTPGYAMKGTDRGRMLGAIVGKAMGSLDSGTGMIEVGVTLQ
jgi:hypothetical protein